ncbi:MAG TPA: MATE family efflux transporter [Candidatus Acidoferrum sp.]|nr:MATE family efflux transporter [Candidatus Acidoferrum sp.]
MSFFPIFRAELRPTLRLALPLVLAELGWMAMIIVDTMVVGRLPNSAEAIGAISVSSVLFIIFAFFGEGLLIGLDTLVSQAFGAGRREDCHTSLINGIYLSFAIAPFLAIPVWILPNYYEAFGVTHPVAILAGPYMRTLSAGLLPLLLFFAVRRTLQGMNMVQPIAFALVSANVINFIGNYIFVFGKFGAPALGVTGAGIATCFSRAYLAFVLVAYLLWYDHRHKTELLRTPLQPNLARIKQLIALGVPAAMQQIAEVTVFALVATLIARLGAVAQAGHQIALNTVAFTYMVPLGLSSASAVRVGQALGRRDPIGARNAGNTAIVLGAGFMACMSVVLLIIPRMIARMYTADETVIRSAITLLVAGSAFQLFDGIQTVATGSLRGTGDTRTPMLCHFSIYWLIGIPLGTWLCFRRHWGALGLWVGLSLSLILIGILLLTFWRRRVRHILSVKYTEDSP